MQKIIKESASFNVIKLTSKSIRLTLDCLRFCDGFSTVSVISSDVLLSLRPSLFPLCKATSSSFSSSMTSAASVFTSSGSNMSTAFSRLIKSCLCFRPSAIFGALLASSLSSRGFSAVASTAGSEEMSIVEPLAYYSTSTTLPLWSTIQNHHRRQLGPPHSRPRRRNQTLMN